MIRRASLLATLLASACLLAPGVPAQAATPVTIPVILPTSGPLAFIGGGEQQALRFVEAEVNKTGGIRGRPLQYQFNDDQSTPQLAVQLASRIVATHPAVLLGSSLVSMCNAMAPLMHSGPVMYCLSPGIHPPHGGYVFTSSTSTVALTNVLIRYFRLSGMTRIGVIVATDATGQDAEKNIRNAMAAPENKTMKLVAFEHFNTSDMSVDAQMARIKAAKPQALIAWSSGASFGTLLKAVTNADLNIPVATTNANMIQKQLDQYKAYMPKVLLQPSSDWLPTDNASSPPAVRKARTVMFDAFKKAGEAPSVATTLAWDPALITVAALRALGPNATAAQVRNWISHLKGFGGINGTYDFVKHPQRGLGEGNVIVAQWHPDSNSWSAVSKPRGAPIKN